VEALSSSAFEPVYVAWDGVLKTPGIGSRTKARIKSPIRLLLEDGRNLEPAPDQFQDKGNRQCLQSLPFGYHRLQFESRGRIAESLVISAPRRSYMNEAGRKQRLGVFAPLYALHSGGSWGAGNFSDLKRLTRYAAGEGAGVIATLPLMPGFLEFGGDPSPYSPISRLFWNEFYVDIERLSELARSTAARKKLESASFRARLNRLRSGQWVDYSQGMKLRRGILQLLAPHANETEMDNFLRKRPDVLQYAQFRAVHDRLRTSWQHWPERLRDGRIKFTDFSAEDERFFLFAQFAAQRQMDEMAAECRTRNVYLYLDLPVGVNRCGFDVWRHKNLFASDASVGAPPDMFFNQGQNWNFPPMIPERMRQTGYAHIRDYLRFQMRHAGILRIDHVMGLHRLYWIPPGFSADEGAYIKYPAEELHAIVCLESHRNRCEIIGENLGTVPAEVNRAMDEHRYRKMYVVQFEQRDKSPALARPAQNAVASLETHDTPTFAAHWLGEDIGFRAKLGQLNREQVVAERERRRKLNTATEKFLIVRRLLQQSQHNPLPIMRVLTSWLRRSAAGIVLLALESLWEEKKPQNVPGTMDEYPNWRRKSALSLEEIEKTVRLSNFVEGSN
jgi:4-alpha-glucanotransferase